MEIQIDIEKKLIFAPLKGKWLVLRPEERVRQRYICRLSDSYGYELDQMDQELQVNNSKRGQGAARADIAVWRSAEDRQQKKSPLIIVECKAENVTVRQEDYYQGFNYASWAGADFFVATNIKETRIFKVEKGSLPNKLCEVADIPTAEIAADERKVKEIKSRTRKFTREEFSKLLASCHNIIRNNDKLSPEAAFDEISKILFIKIRYERDNSDGQIFSVERFKGMKKEYELHNLEFKIRDAKPFYQLLFDRTKTDYKAEGLFEPNEIIRIREDSFEQIVEKLQVYNLSATSDDVKGVAFESFLGKTFRGELGQFFTPRKIVDFMTEVLDPEEGELICDPCCGSGGFLIKAFEYVREKIECDVAAQKERLIKQKITGKYGELSKETQMVVDDIASDIAGKMNMEMDVSNSKGRLHSLSHNYIFGTDANPRMARTAKMNMIMHGDGHGGVHHHDGLLNVIGIWENRFDVILTNPPFGQRVSRDMKVSKEDTNIDTSKIDEYVEQYGEECLEIIKSDEKKVGKSFWSLYDTGKLSGGLTEVLFIERCLNLLKPGGRMGIVLPEGVLNGSRMQSVRDYIESRAKIMLIVSIPQDVFMASGAMVKPSLVFLKKFTEEEKKQYEIVSYRAQIEVSAKYKDELSSLNSKLENATSKEEQKRILKQKSQLEEKKNREIVSRIKLLFDYDIAIAEVKKAGISTTGGEIDNELPDVLEEFRMHRQKRHLWISHPPKMDYQIKLGDIYRRTAINGDKWKEVAFYERSED